MNELARAIAVFIRTKTKDTPTPLRPTTEKKSKHSNSYRVIIPGQSDIEVEWFSGGAEIAGRRFRRDSREEFDLDEVLGYVETILEDRIKRAERQKRIEEMVREHKVLKDLVRADKRISTSLSTWETDPKYSVEFSTKSFSELSMAIDFLMSTSDNGEPPPPRPTLVTATYEYGDNDYSLRELARQDEITDAVWDQVLKMCIDTEVTWSGATIRRVS